MTLDNIREIVIPACKKFNVKRLDVFGSLAQAEGTETSDIDFLVEFDQPDIKPSKRFFGLLHQLFSREYLKRGSTSMEKDALKHLNSIVSDQSGVEDCFDGGANG